MHPSRTLLAAGLAMAAGIAAADDTDLRAQARLHFEAVPTSPIATVGDHTITPEQVALGAMLFFDPRMSASGIFSCHSCHNVGLGGMDGLETSIGHGWQKGPRNAPTVFNAVFNIAQFWDGRAPDLAEQAKGPIQAGVEMANTPTQVLVTLQSMEGYVDAFRAAFPGVPEPISFDNFAQAIEAFETTLITPDAPFDLWLAGDDTALSDQQKQGLTDFLNEGCAVCHNGVNIGGNGYYPFGVVDRPGGDILPEGDRGRFTVTETASDEYVFRAAPLRNIAVTPPYFHSGAVWSLREAVAVMSVAQLGADLDEAEIENIVAFLESLTGQQPQVVHPTLPPRTGGTPRPDEM